MRGLGGGRAFWFKSPPEGRARNVPACQNHLNGVKNVKSWNDITPRRTEISHRSGIPFYQNQKYRHQYYFVLQRFTQKKKTLFTNRLMSTLFAFVFLRTLHSYIFYMLNSFQVSWRLSQFKHKKVAMESRERGDKAKCRIAL